MLDNKAHTTNVYGSLLKDELKRRGISQKDFAEAFELKQSNLSGILNGSRKIPVSLIPIVSELLGIEESVIINAQKNFSSISKIEAEDSDEEKDAKKTLEAFEKLVSVKSLLNGLSKITDSAILKLQTLRERYSLTSPEDLAVRLGLLSESCFRRSDKTGLDHVMISTWVVKARAKACPLGKQYDRDALPQLVPVLTRILHRNGNNTPRQVEEALNEYGIGYIELKKESKASIDGYSFLKDGTPYIALTRRFDRIDNYAFNIMHELGHIYLGHVDENGKINVATHNPESQEAYPLHEEQADKFANEALIPNKVWLLAPPVPLNPYVIQKKYTQWAKSKGLNPWIVLGRVSHETGMYRFTSDTSRSINIGKEGGSMAK